MKSILSLIGIVIVSVIVGSVKPPHTPAIAERAETPKEQPTITKPTEPQKAQEAPETKPEPLSREQIVWNFFINQGFTKEQTAGIMGNLQQEHNFKTDDVPGGLGIAQWMDGRRARLLAKPEPYALETQLAFIIEEFNGSEKRSGTAMRAARTIDEATIVFQDLYERCGKCMQSNRITYAYNFYQRFGR